MSSDLQHWQRYKLEKGQWIGVMPYGYKVIVAPRLGKYNTPGEVSVHETDSLVVQDIFLRYSQGNISLKGLKSYIQEKYAVTLHVATVHRILLNAFYKGIMIWKGEKFTHYYPCLTTPELFDLCQKVRENNHRHALYVPATDSFKKNIVVKGE